MPTSLPALGRYKGTKTVAVTPDYAEIAKLCDLVAMPKQDRCGMALAMGRRHAARIPPRQPAPVLQAIGVRRYTDMPMLVMLEERVMVIMPQVVCCAPPISS